MSQNDLVLSHSGMGARPRKDVFSRRGETEPSAISNSEQRQDKSSSYGASIPRVILRLLSADMPSLPRGSSPMELQRTYTCTGKDF